MSCQTKNLTRARRLVSYLLLLIVATFLTSYRMISSTMDNTNFSTDNSLFLPPVVPTDNRGCLYLNSEGWLRSSRVHHLNDSLPMEFITKMSRIVRPNFISDYQTYLEQSLADGNSWFLAHFDQDGTAQNDPRKVRLWVIRLAYLSIMYHQHKPILAEAEARQKYNIGNECQKLLKHYGVGRYDFECPTTRYIVGGLTNNGLGSNIRAATTTMLMAGLITNRTVLMIKNGKEGPKFLKKPWKLASCPRQDFECFFLPLTPCVPTWEDIKNAYILEGSFSDYFGDDQIRKKIPPNQMDNKVWILQKYGVTTSTPRLVTKMVYEYSKEFIQQTSLFLTQKHILSIALEEFFGDLPIDNPKDFEYPAARNAMNHALTVYALRPNFESRTKLAKIMKEIVPTKLNGELPSIGLPIRASDKCHQESECLPFNDYVRAVNLVQKEYRKELHFPTRPLVLFTTESREMVNAQRNFSKTSNVEFVVNSHDVIPNTGLISEVVHEGRFSADDSMLSAISSFSFQLKARVSVLNCCSNFHMLLRE
eukprot:scaffold24489_cov147-Cylindrotheca_fusiformis.AAC.2